MILVAAISQSRFAGWPVLAAQLSCALGGGTGRLHIPCCDNRGMTTQDVIDQAVALTYRLSGYVLLNLADEAAILALVFC